MVFADILHDGRTGRGDPEPVRMLLRGIPGRRRSPGRPRRRPRPRTETRRPSARRRPGRDSRRETPPERRGPGGRPPACLRSRNLPRPFQTAHVGLGILGADHGAVAAGDAPLRDDRGLPFDDLDRLGRAVPDAGVAAPAVLFDGLDGFKHGFESFMVRSGPPSVHRRRRSSGSRSVRWSRRWLISPRGSPRYSR